MSFFLSHLSDGCVDFEKCGDVVVSPKDNMIGMFCHFCCDIYTNLSEFLHHLQRMHNDVLSFSKAHNVYSVEELMSITHVDQHSQPESNISCDSGLPSELVEATQTTNLAISKSITNALTANYVEFDKSTSSKEKTFPKTVLQWQGPADVCLPKAAATEEFELECDVLAEVEALLFENKGNLDASNQPKEDSTNHGNELDIDLQKEQSNPTDLENKLVFMPIEAETPIETSYCKLNYTENELDAINFKDQTVKTNPEKSKVTFNMKSYAIARSERKREQQQRLRNIKKRIFRSLKLEQHKPLKKLKKSTGKSSVIPQEENISIHFITERKSTDGSKENNTAALQSPLKILPKISHFAFDNPIATAPIQEINTVKDIFLKPSPKGSRLTPVKSTTSSPESSISKKKTSGFAKLKEIIKSTKASIVKENMAEVQNFVQNQKDIPIHTANIDKGNQACNTLKKSPVESANKSISTNINHKIINQKTSPILISKVEYLPMLDLNFKKGEIAKTSAEIQQKTLIRNTLPLEPKEYTGKGNNLVNEHRKHENKGRNLVENIKKPLTRSSNPAAPNVNTVKEHNSVKQVKVSIRRASLIINRDKTIIRPSVTAGRVEENQPEPEQSPKQNNKRKEETLYNSHSSQEAVAAKRNKTEESLSSGRDSLNFDLSDSVVDFLQTDLKTSKLDTDSLLNLAEPEDDQITDPYDHILSQIVSEEKEQQQQSTKDTTSLPEGTNETETSKVRDDLTLLKLVGMPIIFDAKYEELKTVEDSDALRAKASKLSVMLRHYEIFWNPRKFKVQFTTKVLKELSMFTEKANNDLKTDLNVSELKRILNLINAWYADQMNLKYLYKIILSSTVEYYLYLFSFLPKINSSMYFCEWCEESSSTKARYEKHRLMHQCSFPCPHCKRGFKKRGYLINHLRSMHGKEN